MHSAAKHPPQYRDRNPKVDVYERDPRTGADRYAFSTNYARTCRDALAHARDRYPLRQFTRARIDHRSR